MLFTSVASPLYVQHLDRSRLALLTAAAASQGQDNAADDDLLELYHGVRELKLMHEAFCPECVMPFASRVANRAAHRIRALC